MANLIRSAKSGSDWTDHELSAYNIRISFQSPDDFYGAPLPTVASLSNLDPHLFSGTLSTEGLSGETYRLLQYLDLASTANSGQQSAIHDFTKEILRVLGYESRDFYLRSRYAVPLLICCDANRSAQTDVALIRSSAILLVIHGDIATISACNSEAQVIAAAIATFQWNNCTRGQLGQPELDSMTIPCIAVIGTRPIFYLVPVTRELSDAVVSAQYPLSPTLVKKCVVASNSCRLIEGMENPDFRQLALRHYTAFRTLAQTHWSGFII